MLLIGMISFTSMATTPLMDQNQKTVFVQELVSQTNTEFVVNDYQEVFALTEISTLKNSKVEAFTFENVAIPSNSLDFVKDVGWQCNTFKFIKPIDNKKLFDSGNRNASKRINYLFIPIRDDC